MPKQDCTNRRMNQTNAEWINSKISLGFYFIDNFSLQSIRINSLYFIWNLNKSKLCLHNVKKNYKKCTCTLYMYTDFRGGTGGHYGEGAAIQYTTLEPFANFSTLKNIFFLFCHNNGIISLITKHCSLQCFNYLFYSIVQ